MSPFAVARERALRLRQHALKGDADRPVKSTTVIEACLRHHRLNVHDFPKDSPRLNKSDAVLIQRLRTIVVRNDAGPQERARLLGHEIGHVELHPEGMAVHKTGGPPSPTSAGTQYVQAYGARERVERQANVFARELLLPRHIALALHREGQSVADIARAVDVAAEIVTMQLLDALLLPKGNECPAELDDRPLTAEQQLAAYDNRRCLNIVAGPGAGKTKTLIGRVKHLIQNGMAPHRILVLTFSNKASREIVERLEVSGVKDAQNVWAGTFHQFGLEFIRKYHDRFDVDPDVQVLDKLAQIELATTLLPGIGLEHYSAYDEAAAWLDDLFLNVINRCREELVSAADFQIAVQSLPDGGTPQQRDSARIFTAYEAKLAELRVVDFSSLVELPARKLTENPGEFEAIMNSFDHLLVDEYQDVNRATAILLKEFSNRARGVWVVGDPHQAIYRFRGATLRNLTEFSRDFPDAYLRGLRKNWRTGETLVGFINHVAHMGRLARENEFRGLQGNPAQDSFSVRIASSPCEDDMYATVAREIQTSVANGSKRFGEHLVLAKANDTVAQTAAHLEQLGVPCLYFGGFFEREEIRDVLSLFQLLVERQPAALARVGLLPGVRLSEQDVERLQAAVAADRRLERLQWLSTPPTNISSEGMAALARLRKGLGTLTWSSNPWDAICRLLLDADSGLLRHHVDPSVQGSIRGLALWMLAYFCRTHDGHGRRLTLSRLLHRVRQRMRIKDVGPLRELPPEAEHIDAVRLMSIHGSKGLEAKCLHLLDAHQKAFEPYQRPNDSRIPAGLLEGTELQHATEAEVEADNLLYVAVSRAKEQLTLYHDSSVYRTSLPTSVLTYEGGKDSVTSANGTSPFQAPTGRTISHDMPTLEGLLSYASCPKRYFYREVAKLGGAGDGSLGARALYAAIAALRQLSSQGQSSAASQDLALAHAWETAGLPTRDDNPALWRLGLSKVSAGLELLGRACPPPETVVRAFGGHQLAIALHAGPRVPESLGSLVLAYSPWSQSEDRKILQDVAYVSGSWREPKTLRAINLRHLNDREVKGFNSGTAARTLEQMKLGRYPARPNSGKCSSCPYLFICTR